MSRWEHLNTHQKHNMRWLATAQCEESSINHLICSQFTPSWMFRLGCQQTLEFVILISNLLGSMKGSVPSTILCAWLDICIYLNYVLKRAAHRGE